ncbi:MAG TPA: AMP-binding protein [Streptosporangiaceae bacterium]|nr:AMP-binding protein [Streptosporangiaceae bacterium]
MTDSVINRIVSQPPQAGHQLTLATLAGVSSLPLTEVYDQAERLAVALAEAGLVRGDRIGILSANRLEWVLLDLAALRLGAVTAGFEPAKFDLTANLLSDYNLSVLFTDRSQPQRRKFAVPWARTNFPRDIRPIDEIPELIAGADPDFELPDIEYGPRDITTIKFTSGSTGTPKGLATTAGSIDSSINAVQQLFHHADGDNVFCFLPLSLLQQRYWLYSALAFGHDLTISTYEAAFAVMRRVDPTVVMGVPGFYESAKKHIESRAARSSLPDAAQQLFGTKIRYLWTGSAPARPSMLRFFTDLGFPIYEGYGLNETCIVAKNHPGAHREGSVGQVLPGKKVLLDADSVVSIHSDYPVNWRYEYAAPGESERVFGPDGTVRTGDLGYLDDDGFLFIRGRADDVIVLDNGKKIIVRPLEEYLKASPAIEDAVIFCPAQTHLVAVVSPAADPPDATAITGRLAQANAAFTKDEQISHLVIAPERFSIANGLLTSQFKPRRQQILQAFWDQINGKSGSGQNGNHNGF